MDGSQDLSGAFADPHRDESGHGSVKSYLTGFILSVILTATPFGLIISHALPAGTAVPVCIGFGIVQIVIHLIFFLHMDGSSGQTWNMAAFVFTVVVVAILVIGSLWVMYHLNTHMMPGMMPTE